MEANGHQGSVAARLLSADLLDAHTSTAATFVPESFTRKPVKMERFIRPMALRMKKANVTHPELQATFQLPIIGVKKNPQSPMYTQLGVMTKGTVVEVNVSELGLVTTGGKVVWAKYARECLGLPFDPSFI